MSHKICYLGGWNVFVREHAHLKSPKRIDLWGFCSCYVGEVSAAERWTLEVYPMVRHPSVQGVLSVWQNRDFPDSLVLLVLHSWTILLRTQENNDATEYAA